MGRLSTHVLDTARGVPAEGVLVVVHARTSSGMAEVASTVTGPDGRPGKALLEGDRIAVGEYELTFHVGDYFRGAGVALTSPPFLDRVVIRIGISDAQGHYHVPLLVSPYGYSTYRGS